MDDEQFLIAKLRDGSERVLRAPPLKVVEKKSE
jgi:hypothetical protein